MDILAAFCTKTRSWKESDCDRNLTVTVKVVVEI
jgi:hypothetical protein